MSLNARLASQLGRPQLALVASTAGASFQGSPTIAGAGAGGFSSEATNDPNSIFVGQLSLGFIGLLVVALGGFYFWTRGHQR